MHGAVSWRRCREVMKDALSSRCEVTVPWDFLAGTSTVGRFTPQSSGSFFGLSPYGLLRHLKPLLRFNASDLSRKASLGGTHIMRQLTATVALDKDGLLIHGHCFSSCA